MMRFSLVTLLSCLTLFVLGCEEQLTSPDAGSRAEAYTPDRFTGLDGAAKSGTLLNFTAPLSGRQEVDPVATNATGLAKFQLSADGSALSYTLIVANILNVRMAHIHLAPAGENGSVVVWLYPDAPPPMLIQGRSDGILAEGTITADDLTGPLAGMTLDDLIAAMSEGGTYVNVHTNAHPGGEIRGQIVHGSGVN